MFKHHFSKYRLKAVVWAVETFGLPEGFSDLTDYHYHVNKLMDDQEFEEYYLEWNGSYVAHVSLCVSNDVHHKGDILSVINVTYRPGFSDRAFSKALVRFIHDVAIDNGCQWVSKCKRMKGDITVNTFVRTKGE